MIHASHKNRLKMTLAQLTHSLERERKRVIVRTSKVSDVDDLGAQNMISKRKPVLKRGD